MSDESSSIAAPAPSSKKMWGICGGLAFPLLLLFGLQFASEPFLALTIGLLPIEINDKVSLARLLLEGLCILGIMLVIKAYGARPADIGIGKFKPKYLVGTLVGFMVYYALTFTALLLSKAFLPIDHDQVQEIGYEGLSGIGMVLAFMALVIVTPIAEEILFRGFMFAGFRRRLPFWATAILVSVVFAWVHGQWNVAIDVFMLSLVLCYLRESTGSLWPSILLHMLKNAVAFYLLYLYNG